MAKKPMRANHAVRDHAGRRIPALPARSQASRPDSPGAFQCLILRAFGLRKGYRDVFLLKEIQGHTLVEIAAILGISIDTALARWQSARREIGHLGDSEARERK